jgi:hypothetical protein
LYGAFFCQEALPERHRLFVRPGCPFLRPDPLFAHVGARRSGQGWRHANLAACLCLCQAPHLAAPSTTALLLRSYDDQRGARFRERISRATALYPVGPKKLNHDADMRIGSEAPRRRTHSSSRHNSHESHSGPRHIEPSSAIYHKRNAWAENCVLLRLSVLPSETTPSRTRRHKAIRSLRAKATIMVLRVARAFSVRARNHCARALSFWNMRNRHASWIMPRRTRALPDRASPFSRRFLPLSSGAPVSLA